MDNAQNKIDRLERSIAREGETVTLERLSVDPTTGIQVIELSIVVPAWVRSSIPQDLIDNEARDMKVVISPRLLLAETVGSPPQAFGIPQRDDRIIIQGSSANIQQVDPIYYGGVPVRINMICRG